MFSSAYTSVLEDNRLINVLYSLTFSKNRDDVAKLIISKMDCLKYLLVY